MLHGRPFLCFGNAKVRCFYSSHFENALPGEHPYSLDQLRLSKDMLLDGGVLRPEEIVEVGDAAQHLLRSVHDAGYVQKIYSCALDRKEEIRLGLPVTPQLYTRSASEVEATRMTCRAALEEGVAVCLAGGKHHAFSGYGSSYSVFNDVAVAIRDLQMWRPNLRIMVVDTDAHQGDGTNAILAGDSRVFTYSIHVMPSSSRPAVAGSMDVETVRYVEGDMYLRQLFSTLAAALDTFSPDLVIWIAGADSHRNDRFGQMMLSLKEMQRRDEVLLKAFIRNRIPVAVLYGGGCNRQAEFTAKIHRNTVAMAKQLAAEYRGL